MLELTFDETFVKPYHLELYHKPIQEFFMIKTSQGELIMLCIVMVKQHVKSLDAHTHILVYQSTYTLFKSTNTWCSRLDHFNYELWNIVEAPYTKPATHYNAWSNDQKKNANLDAKAMNALFCALTKEEFNRVSTTTSVN